MYKTDCPHCGATTYNLDESYLEEICDVCGRDVFEHPDDPVAVGDILEDSQGLAIVTAHGVWELSIEEAISLNAGLSAMLLSTLTRPWSSEDTSTIISRGTRHLTIS